MRVVLDVNVIIAALISPYGAPAPIIDAWRRGAFELVISDRLIEELRHSLAYPKLASLVPAAEADRVVAWPMASALRMPDPEVYPLAQRSRDPEDDFLLALAVSSAAILVTGDADLVELAVELPIDTPRSFLALIDAEPR